MNPSDLKPPSPCIKVCVIDPVSELCIGCGRDISEISLWSEMGAAQQKSVLADLPRRFVGMAARTTRGGRTVARRTASGR